MRKPLIALFAFVLTLPFGCKSEEEEPPNPLATRDGFCQAWAEAACQPKVVEYCNAKSADDCQDTQREVCLDLIPRTYASAHAESCLRAVAAAYEDGDLNSDELGIVQHLAAPCDLLSSGTSDDGEACVKSSDCNTAGGFTCVIKMGADSGVCAQPEVVGPAEECDGPKQVCGEGYYCNGNCVVYKKTDSGVCEGDYQCKPEDHCVPDADDPETSHCRERAGAGEACSSDGDCQSSFCVIESGTEGECVSTIRLARTEPLCADLR
jgi:hypothetical protein